MEEIIVIGIVMAAFCFVFGMFKKKDDQSGCNCGQGCGDCKSHNFDTK